MRSRYSQAWGSWKKLASPERCHFWSDASYFDLSGAGVRVLDAAEKTGDAVVTRVSTGLYRLPRGLWQLSYDVYAQALRGWVETYLLMNHNSGGQFIWGLSRDRVANGSDAWGDGYIHLGKTFTYEVTGSLDVYLCAVGARDVIGHSKVAARTIEFTRLR